MPLPASRAAPAARDDLLAARVSAALRRELVLDHRAREAGLRVAGDRAAHVHRVAVAGVGVADHRDRDRRADVPALIEHLAVGDQLRIRRADPSRRHREAAHEGEAEPGALDELRRERVEATRHHVEPGLVEERAEARGGSGRSGRRHGAVGISHSCR
jgi:hypothetical protein